MRLAACALPGAVLGAVAAVKMDSLLFQKVLGIFILVMVATVLIPTSGRTGNSPARPPADGSSIRSCSGSVSSGGCTRWGSGSS